MLWAWRYLLLLLFYTRCVHHCWYLYKWGFSDESTVLKYLHMSYVLVEYAWLAQTDEHILYWSSNDRVSFDSFGWQAGWLTSMAWLLVQIGRMPLVTHFESKKNEKEEIKAKVCPASRWPAGEEDQVPILPASRPESNGKVVSRLNAHVPIGTCTYVCISISFLLYCCQVIL